MYCFLISFLVCKEHYQNQSKPTEFVMSFYGHVDGLKTVISIGKLINDSSESTETFQTESRMMLCTAGDVRDLVALALYLVPGP